MQTPQKWTLLLTSENHGLVGEFGSTWDGHPAHYERVDVVAASGVLPVQRPIDRLSPAHRDFIDSVIEVAFEGGDLDGGTIQELAEKAGLLEARTMTEPCTEDQRCRCAVDNDFPLTCYQKTYRAEPDTPAAAQQPAIPEGYALVPIEPDHAMQAAGAAAIRFDTTILNKLFTGNAVFRAMVAHSPAAAPVLLEDQKP